MFSCMYAEYMMLTGSETTSTSPSNLLLSPVPGSEFPALLLGMVNWDFCKVCALLLKYESALGTRDSCYSIIQSVLSLVLMMK